MAQGGQFSVARDIANFIWSIADLLRGPFRRGKYQDVILPFTVLRRVDCVLAPTKQRVLERNAQLKGKLKDVGPQLRRASGFSFYNTSRYDFETLLGDAGNLATNLMAYINGFSDNMRTALERFRFEETVKTLEKHNLLYMVMERFKNIDLHPDKVDNHTMGSVFEELIRKFNEALDENPGEHFTPRDVVSLMAGLLLAPDKRRLAQEHFAPMLYDPCPGTGGMLTVAKSRILADNPTADVHLFGQELNEETWAVCVADLLMMNPDGRDADNILQGSTLSADGHSGKRFDYMLANPPYGYDWKRDEEAVRAEYDRGERGRFYAGLPRISDGQLLFLQHMLGRMKSKEDGGSRVCIIMNGSPLFTGDAGSGESEIRRWILENDWLEALVALPEQMFYNTGIATYVWVLSNRKPEKRRGKVQLINATDIWVPMRKSLGDKRRMISPEQTQQIVDLYTAFTDGERCKLFPSAAFGYRKVTIERPLRLNFQASPERIKRLEDESAFRKLAESKKKDKAAKAAEEKEGRKLQQAIRTMLETMPKKLYKDRVQFLAALDAAEEKAGTSLAAPVRKAILSALSERDEEAEICRDKDGNPDPDSELRDYENVPLDEDISDYFKREVAPHVPDAWVNTQVRDEKDGDVGKVGYEVNFNRYFYKYVPPRALEEIEADIAEVEKEIAETLKDGGG